MAVEVTNQQEQRQLWQVVDLLDRASTWESITNDPSGVWIVQPGSPLAVDDAATAPRHHLSSYSWNAITVAVDHLHCLRRSLIENSATGRPQVFLHTHAQASLLRGALENAARVIWLLGPEVRRQRVFRRLGLQAREITASDKIHKIIGATPPRTTQVRSDELRALGKAAGLTSTELKKVFNPHEFGYARIVTQAATLASLDSNLARFAWNGCSALAHGDFHATLSLLDREVVGQQDTMMLGRITMPVQLLHAAAIVSTRLIDAALSRYRECAGRQI
ncbi:MAG: hypothetical protein GEV28_10935 [Actinophytocola sp.]|uniref:hypothetical protein n=1 Tax=Actinophytocola sp. TaxID=1872138 RepID=UPI001326A4A7|nr:hypothetical protein [Actinophytocola sp.]MPZ80875.1 hypothetical protein [Actinophytocola sp.]